jgi:hypothetical protein
MIAAGFTVTLTVNIVPVQLPDGVVGVRLYTAVTAAAPALASTSFNALFPASAPALPVNPLPDGDDHAYKVPDGMLPVGLYVNAMVVHVVVLCEDMIAAGFTVTVTVNALPVQLPDDGVTL